MRLCICGLHRDGAVKKAEKVLGVESVNIDYPGMDENDYKLFNYAAETFKYFNKEHVVFDGGVFDCFKNYSDEGWNDLQEQVIHSVIANLDGVVIITEGMTDKQIEYCNEFASLYKDKFVVIQNENEFSIG